MCRRPTSVENASSYMTCTILYPARIGPKACSCKGLQCPDLDTLSRCANWQNRPPNFAADAWPGKTGRH